MDTTVLNTKTRNNALGLNEEYTSVLTERLNNLLANYQVLYMNVRGFHWNIKGDKFFELHAKFEELYDDLALKIDEVAERVVTLGGEPLHTFKDYLTQAEIKVVKSVSDGRQAVASLVNSLSVLIQLQRELLTLSDDANDEGTNSQMSDNIREQEKLVWMYKAYLNQ